MRYLKNVETNEVITVSDDDDKKFDELTAQRREGAYANRPLYVQTGAHDPDVKQVEVLGQDPANGDRPQTQAEMANAAGEVGPTETADTKRAKKTGAK